VEPPLLPLRVVPKLVTGTQRGTIIKYLVRRGEDQTIHRGTYRAVGTQPTPPREALGSDGPKTPPSDAATPRGRSPETVDWGDALHGCQVDWGAACEAKVSLTRPTEYKQPSGSLVTASTTDVADTHREAGAQPTPPGETLGANEPDTQPSDVLAPQGDYPEGFNWRVDLRDNTYKYERLVGPVGSAEQAGGRDTPFRTTATLNLQPIRLLTRWSDEPLGNRGGCDRGGPATREDTRLLGPADSPVSQTLPDVHDEKATKHYVIHVDKLKLCTAATQSHDSVATQPTTQ